MQNHYLLSRDKSYYLCFFRKGGFFLFDREDFPLVSKHTWHLGKRGYPCMHKKRKKITLHRLLLPDTAGMDVDHISGDKMDNRRRNLRVCTHQQNMFNQKRRCTNTSGYTGVSFMKNVGRYEAYLHHDGKKMRLGLYADVREAAKARDRVAAARFGEYARLNFPLQDVPAHG